MEILSHGSFPRSGNHLLDTVLKFSYPLCDISWIEHNAWVSNKSQNFICVVRDPVDAICSWVFLTKDNRHDRADKLLNWYIRYHKFMLDKKDVLLIDFNQLIDNPSHINELIYKQYGVKNMYNIPKDFYNVYMNTSYPENSPTNRNLESKGVCDEIRKSFEYKEAKKIYKNISKRIKGEF